MKKAGNMMDTFMTAGQLGQMASEEVEAALRVHGIRVEGAGGDADGVYLWLGGLHDAEAMLTLVLWDDDAAPGSLYDRVASSCAMRPQMPGPVTDDEFDGAAMSGWVWMVHPDMTGRVVGWHVGVAMSTADACQVAARLNELRNGGAL